MAVAGFSLIAIVVFVAILTGLWTGVVGLRQAGRNGAWWTMLTAMVGITLGIVAYGVFMWILIDQSSRGTSAPNMNFLPVMIMMIPASLLLFSIGFAMHGLKTTRVQERLNELEQLTGAMSEEIDRLREGGPNA
jgi:hypothetical protein